MKKIFSYLLLALALPFVAACDSDTDSNPVLQEPESFVLNVPPYATNNVFDLQYAQSLELHLYEISNHAYVQLSPTGK